MNNLVHIHQFKAQKHSRKQLDLDVTFIIGIVLTMIAPTTIYLAYGGPVPFAIFIFTFLTGIISGLVNYLYYPYQAISCVDTNRTNKTTSTTGTSTPPPTIGSEKRAA